MLRDKRQHVSFSFAESHVLGVALGRDNTDCRIANLERDAKPVDGQRPDDFDFAKIRKRRQALARCKKRPARTEHVLGHASL